MDVFVQEAGEAKYVVVSNSTDDSISIINATDNQVKEKVAVGANPGGVSVYASGAAEKGNQATASVTSNGVTASFPLNKLLEDHGMPE